IFNRRVIEAHQTATPPLSLVYAVPDHPWVDNTQGAAVRISMSVGVSGTAEGRLQTVTQEQEAESGEVDVELATQQGIIHADLKVGANVAGAKRLQANDLLSNRGVIPHGAGFIVTPDQAQSLGLGTVSGLDNHIRPYRNGRDLTGTPRGALVIDLFGLQSDEVRQRFPAVYQWLLERAKPERDENPRQRVREMWWLFAEARVVMRRSLLGLPRYIVTGQVAKHRVFQWLDASILPDDKLIAIASDNVTHLGVLSSQVHSLWALTAGGRLGVGNDPVYSKSTCFETFPFPSDDTGLTPALTERIGSLAEQLDAHRKTCLAAHPALTLTGLYNVLDKLRSGEALSDKDKAIHTQGLVGVLKSLHDELDAAVLAAYGWPDLALAANTTTSANTAVNTDTLLQRLVALNARRAQEEASGLVRWLRPAFQRGAALGEQTALDTGDDADTAADTDAETDATPRAAKASTPWPAGSRPRQY
ncbi:MAG: class I SAM-dependent DNA methyltransferase, partial [Burkholderiales bacterium]|nr:class I SAM-dependent DNA methyltransferase [Burkholderiales bacterium]